MSAYERRKRRWLYLRNHPQLRRVMVRNPRPRARRRHWIARGFWTEAHFGVSSSMGRMTSGVALGKRWRKFVIAALFDTSYVWQRTELGDERVTDKKFTLAIGPLVEIQALRIGFFEVYGATSLTFLAVWDKVQNDAKDWHDHWQEQDSHTIKGYGFGLSGGAGARYYLGGRIGLGVELGLTMSYLKSPDNDPSTDAEVKTFSIGPYAMASIVSIW